MKNRIIINFFLILLFFNSSLFSAENNKTLKVGLLAPLSGPYSEIGSSLLYSLQLALEEINDKDVTIVPRDSGYNDAEKINLALNDMRAKEVRIVIGPISNEDFAEVEKFSDMIFISPSNISPKFSNNIISIGVSLESQLKALINFLKKKGKDKTIIMYPRNNYLEFVEKKIKEINLKNARSFTYNSNPEVLTGEIEKLTNYSQRKRRLELRKKCLKIKRMNNQLKN